MKDEKITVNPIAKPVAAAKPAVAAAKPAVTAAKTEAPEKTVAPEKVAAVEAAPVKEKPAKETKAAKKSTVKKASVKKAPAKAVVVKESLCLEYADKSYSKDDLMKIAKDVWKYDLKEKAGDLKSIELYVKPEENKVYYVFNGSNAGEFNI